MQVVRDYMLRGLPSPVERTTGGYGVFDTEALEQLCLVRAAFDEGVGLDLLTQPGRALDARNPSESSALLGELGRSVGHRRRALARLQSQLTALRIEFARQAAALP